MVLITLLVHIVWAVADSSQNQLRDLYLYNAIWVWALLAIIGAPLSVSRTLISSMALAILFWGAGSLLTSLAAFGYVAPEWASDISYSLFYPPLFIAISRLNSAGRLSSLEVFDAVIFGLGFTSLLTTLLLLALYPQGELENIHNFFLIFYPVGDVLLLLLTTIHIITRGFNRRVTLFTLGVIFFAAGDTYYLWLSHRHLYFFASISDDLWLISIALLTFSLYQFPQSSRTPRAIPPALTAAAIFASPVLLAISALNPGLIPLPLLLPSIANILLALIRMNTALREARSVAVERALARTDELTGLPNRRRMISELEDLGESDGALLLLDLDGFKPVNDQYGHAVGDHILREVARRFSRSLPEGALLARLGGDEFGVIVRGNYEHTLEAAYALRASLTYPFTVAGSHISVNVSIGYVHNDGRGDLLKRADDAMYRAKNSDMGVVQSLSL